MDLFFALASGLVDPVVLTVATYPDQDAAVVRLSVRCGAGGLVWSSDVARDVKPIVDAAKASAGKHRVRLVTP